MKKKKFYEKEYKLVDQLQVLTFDNSVFARRGW